MAATHAHTSSSGTCSRPLRSDIFSLRLRVPFTFYDRSSGPFLSARSYRRTMRTVPGHGLRRCTPPGGREKGGNGGNERIIFGSGRKNRDDEDRCRETLRVLSASVSRRFAIRILPTNDLKKKKIQRKIRSIEKFGRILLAGRKATKPRYIVAVSSFQTRPCK